MKDRGKNVALETVAQVHFEPTGKVPPEGSALSTELRPDTFLFQSASLGLGTSRVRSGHVEGGRNRGNRGRRLFIVTVASDRNGVRFRMARKRIPAHIKHTTRHAQGGQS